MNWRGLRAYLVARCAEKTTWGGLLTFATTFGGIAIEPARAEQIAVAGWAMGSLLLVLLKEKGSEK